MVRAAIYARISSDRDGTELGVGRQVEDCERLVARQGWEVDERYVDDDVSAYSGKPRPAYRRMLDDLRGGYLDAVVVWDLDRLHRQPKELEEFFELCEAAGVSKLASVTGELISRPTTGSSLLVSSVLWLPRRATIRAAGSGARRKLTPRPGRSVVAAHAPTATRTTS